MRMNRRKFVGLSTLALAASAGPGALVSAPTNRASASATGGLRAGAATSDITPDKSVSLNGVVMRTGPVKEVHDPLFARCLVLDDGKTRFAFAICDVRMISRSMVDRARKVIEEKTGIAQSNILISATHNHSSPCPCDINLGAADLAYDKFFIARIAEGIQQACANLSPARVGFGSVMKPEHLFTRRWFVRPGTAPTNPFGQKSDRAVMYPASDTIEAPCGVVDPQVSILSVQHADGRPLAVLANYGLHYMGGVPAGSISADYFGVFSKKVETLLGGPSGTVVAMMSNGTSGNVSNIDARKKRSAAPPYSQMQLVADDLAAAVVKQVKEISYRADLRLSVVASELVLGVRRPDAPRLEWARQLAAKIENSEKLSRPEIYAQENLHLAEMPAEIPIHLQVLRVGDIGVAAIPCEVFAETGLAIKKQSPVPHTFTIELANGWHGYLPTPADHAVGGYETWPARSSLLEVAAADKIRDRILEMLKASK